LNSGQTCIAPDYVLADRSIVADLVDKIVANVRDFRAGEADPGLRIVNQRQFDRLVSLISATDGKVVTGGRSDGSTLRIEPTVIVDPSPTDPVMADEIFGPLLPVLTVESVAMHCLVPSLPFGGVGASGMGAYHGRWGFETLSHRRAVLSKPAKPDPRLVYPPYTERALNIMRRLF